MRVTSAGLVLSADLVPEGAVLDLVSAVLVSVDRVSADRAIIHQEARFREDRRAGQGWDLEVRVVQA